MLTQPLLRRIIAQAVVLWSIEPVTIYRSSSDGPRAARIAVFNTGYELECLQRDLVTAFGWSGNGRRGFSPSEIRELHERLVSDMLYRDRYIELALFANTLNTSSYATHRLLANA